MSGEIIRRDDGAITIVEISAPERLNALNLDMWRELTRTFRALSAEEAVRCIVLRGAGDKAFAAGADIAEFENERYDLESARTYGRTLADALQAVDDCRHPVIAMIQGPCVGGGLELVAVTDMRIAAASSRFGVPVNRLGLVVTYDEMRGIVDLVGKTVALEIVLEGRVFGAEEALAKGLVNRLVAYDAIEVEAMATARRIAVGAPLAARWHKQFAKRLLSPRPLDAAERDESFQYFATEDLQIGSRSFLAKTKPDFTGR